MNMILIIALGAAFTNPQAVEQSFDNSPSLARVAIEANCDQATVDKIEAQLVPPPTLEQQEADLKTAKALIEKTADDLSKDAAIIAIDAKLAAIDAAKPKPEQPLDGKQEIVK